jgi:hypothetical protein
MGMHNIEQHGQPQLVRPIHQTLQLLRRTKPRTDGEETGYLVPKRGIVGVFHDRHELDTVVPEAGDTGEDVVPEFDVGCAFRFRRGDADCAVKGVV